MGSGASRSKTAKAQACPPPSAAPAAAPAARAAGGGALRGAAPAASGGAHGRQPAAQGAAARPKTVLRPTTHACSQASTRPSTQSRPCTQAAKTARAGTGRGHGAQRPDTEYSQAATRPSTEWCPPAKSGNPEVQVLAFNFGAERTTPPVSDRSTPDGAKMPLETVLHFPPPPDGGAITEEDGRSSTTYDSASVHDTGSVPPSRGRTPGGHSRTSASHSRPGTRGLDAAMVVTQEGDEFMVFPDEEGPELQGNATDAGSPRSECEKQEYDAANGVENAQLVREEPADPARHDAKGGDELATGEQTERDLSRQGDDEAGGEGTGAHGERGDHGKAQGTSQASSPDAPDDSPSRATSRRVRSAPQAPLSASCSAGRFPRSQSRAVLIV